MYCKFCDHDMRPNGDGLKCHHCHATYNQGEWHEEGVKFFVRTISNVRPPDPITCSQWFNDLDSAQTFASNHLAKFFEGKPMWVEHHGEKVADVTPK